MSLWVWVLLLAALIKLPLAGLMLWIPFRYDESMRSPEPTDSSDAEEDGGTKALPGGPTDPHPRAPLPRKPRRGPHGAPRVPAPPRIRTRAYSKLPARVSH